MRKLAADVDAGGICSITQDQEGRFIFSYWEHYALNKRKKLLASPLKIVYQQGEQFQAIFAEEDKKTPLSRIGAVLATRNNENLFPFDQ